MHFNMLSRPNYLFFSLFMKYLYTYCDGCRRSLSKHIIDISNKLVEATGFTNDRFADLYNYAIFILIEEKYVT